MWWRGTFLAALGVPQNHEALLKKREHYITQVDHEL